MNPLVLVIGGMAIVAAQAGSKTGRYQSSLHAHEISQTAATLAFPQWLTEFTGLREWPGMDPPYIPLNFIRFDGIPPLVPHAQGVCDGATRDAACSFDCYNCVSFDDIYTCPVLSQTFDDGPTDATPALVRGLKRPSTFFTLGINIVRYPETYRDAVARGHVMGSHTWSHKFLPSLSNEQIVAQIQWSVWAMNATSGHLPKWFRPPFGGVDNRVRAIVRQFGMQSVLWDFDTFDWKLLPGIPGDTRTDAAIYRDVNTHKLKNGGRGLILEHDAAAKTVGVALHINHNVLGDLDQMTVPQCVNGNAYLKQF